LKLEGAVAWLFAAWSVCDRVNHVSYGSYDSDGS
jgi:hypothetical protein